MKVHKNVLISIILFLALGLAQLATPSAVFASGTVGNGTPGSCTESAFDDALSGGGAVNFNCGAAPHTITITGTKVIADDTQINGGGLITISGGDAFRVFTVNASVNFTITGLTVSDGYNVGNGGGMFIDSGATVTVTDSTFKDNNVLDGYGGAIYVSAATLNVSTSTFSNNGADVTSIGTFALGGGAIQNNDGTVEILRSTFNGNTVTSPFADGGAIYNGDLDGAGNVPDANADTMTVGNSTFYNNTLVNDTGSSSGGAIRSNGDITLAHNTFSDNDSGVSEVGSGGESGTVTFASGTATVVYNIFANSSSFTPNPAPAYDCAKRSLTTEFFGGNVIETNFSCGSPSVPLMADPNLGAFQDNGGPTFTMAPAIGSNAIGNAATCASAVTIDQRGVSRPQGGVSSCDIGAVEVDTTAPTVTLEQAAGQADPTNSAPVNFTVTFSEPAANFVAGDVNLSAGTAGGVLTSMVTGGPTVFNVAVSGMTTPGTIVASINAGAATDIALNPNVASTSSDNIVTFDATGPTVTINKAGGQADPTNTSPVNFTVVFDEAVTGFDETDVTIDGTAGPTTKVVTGSGTTYNVAVDGLGGDGTVTALVNAGAVADALGNLSTASTTASVMYDGTAPTVSSISLVGTSPTNATSVQFLVTFTESVSGAGAISNFSLAAGSPTGAEIDSVTGAGTTRTVTVLTGTDNSGTIKLNMANSAGMADAAGNAISGLPFTAGASYTVDKSQPTVLSINRVTSTPTTASSVDFLVTFSENVNGGNASNFALTLNGVSGASISDVTGSGTTRTVTVATGTGDGSIRLDLDNSAGLTDGAGNTVSNIPFITGESYDVDRTIPSVTIEQKVGQNDPTKNSPIEFTVTFSETVSGFTAADVTLSSGTAEVTDGPAAIYNVSVSGMDEGILTATIPASAAVDTAGNNSSASTSADNEVTFDTTTPTVTINKKAGQSDPAGTSPIEFTVVFSEDVTGFTNDDVTLSGDANPSSAVVTASSGTTYNVAVTGMNQGGLVSASLAAGVANDAAGNLSLASTSTDNQVAYDPDNPTVTISLADGQDETTGFSPANFTVVFSEPVTGFATDDVDIDGTSGATTATVTQIAPNDGTTYNVAVSGMTSNGTAIVSVPAGAALDSALLPNLPSLSATVTFTFVKPGVPGLVAPANRVIITGLQPLLNWNDSNPGAQYYRIQVSTINTFVTTVIDETNIVVSEFTPPANLTPGVRYYWRVRALNAIGQASAWSTIRNFRTSLETPVLTSPIGGASSPLDHDRPTFDWDDIPGAANYTLQISTASNFSTGLITRTVPGSSYMMPTDLAQKKVFYWRVMAKTPVVRSAWSTNGSFKTGNPPTVPVLATPATNALVTILNPLFNWGNSTLPLPAGNTTFEYYQIQVADNTDFDSPVIDKQITGITSSQYQSELADGLVTDKKYYWRVRAVNDFGSVDQFSAWSKVFTFRSAMEKPVLVAPDNTTTPALIVRRPAFDWQDTTGATGYQIQISQFANMSMPLVNVNVSASEYTPTVDLPANKVLFWRVRAKGPNGPSLWPEKWTFKTGNPPSTPTLLTPANNTLSKSYFPLFDWSTSTLPAGSEFMYYEFQIDNDNDFSSPAIHEFIDSRADSRYLTQPTDVLDPNTTYYWRVRAVNDVDLTVTELLNYSNWSTVWKIRMGLTPPTLVAPLGTINTQPDIFDWGVVPGATGYTLQVSTSSTFSTLLLNVTLPDDLYDPTVNLPLNKTIHWRVRANGTNKSAWSTSSFIIDTIP